LLVRVMGTLSPPSCDSSRQGLLAPALGRGMHLSGEAQGREKRTVVESDVQVDLDRQCVAKASRGSGCDSPTGAWQSPCMALVTSALPHTGTPYIPWRVPRGYL